MSKITSDKCTEYIQEYDEKIMTLNLHRWTLDKLARTNMKLSELYALKNLSSVEVKLQQELEQEVVMRKEDYDQERERLLEALGTLSDPLEIRVIRYRYVRGYTYSKIAEQMVYSERHIIRIHNEAIKNIKIKTCHSD